MKRINTMELYEKVTEIGSKVDSIDSRLDRIEAKLDALNGEAVKHTNPVKTGKSKSTKSTKKDSYEVVATRQDNVQKVYEAMGYKKGDKFDRNKYEATAKKLGVWSDRMHRVVGTYK